MTPEARSDWHVSEKLHARLLDNAVDLTSRRILPLLGRSERPTGHGCKGVVDHEVEGSRAKSVKAQ